MKFDIQSRIDDLYSEFLMEYYADEVRCKDHLIDMIDNQIHREEFEIEVLKALGFSKEEIDEITNYDDEDVNWAFRI